MYSRDIRFVKDVIDDTGKFYWLLTNVINIGKHQKQNPKICFIQILVLAYIQGFGQDYFKESLEQTHFLKIEIKNFHDFDKFVKAM